MILDFGVRVCVQLRDGCERGEGGEHAHAQAPPRAGQGSGAAPGLRRPSRAGDPFVPPSDGLLPLVLVL